MSKEKDTQSATDKSGDAKKNERVELPVLVDLVFSFSGFFLLAGPLAVAGVSYISGVQPMQIFIRTGITIFILGILLLVLSSKVSAAALDAAYRQVEEDLSNLDEGYDQTIKA
jgi:hypothetical protein